MTTAQKMMMLNSLEEHLGISNDIQKIIKLVMDVYSNPEEYLTQYRISRDTYLLKRTEDIYKKIAELEQKLDVIYSRMATRSDIDRIIHLLSETPDDSEEEILTPVEVQKLVLEYVNSQTGVLYPSDIADALGIDYLDVLEALEVLAKDGKIKTE